MRNDFFVSSEELLSTMIISNKSFERLCSEIDFKVLNKNSERL